ESHHRLRGDRSPREGLRRRVVARRRSANHVSYGRRGPQRKRRVLTEHPGTPRVAITTDWLTSFGGAERVLQQLRLLYPDAPIYTSVYDPSRVPIEMRDWDIRPSRLQRFPFVRYYSRALLPLMPRAFEAFDFGAFDIVITVSSAFSKNIA